MEHTIQKKERELYALRAKAVARKQRKRFEQYNGKKKSENNSQTQPDPHQRLAIATGQESRDDDIQTISQTPKSKRNNSNSLFLNTVSDDFDCERDDNVNELSMDSSANSTTSSDRRNGPFVFTKEFGNEVCVGDTVSPLSNAGDWGTENLVSPLSNKSSPSPRCKMPNTKALPTDQRLTPSNGSVPSALLGVVFEGAEEEIVLFDESVSDAGSIHHNLHDLSGRRTPGANSYSSYPLVFQDVPLTPNKENSRDYPHRRGRPQPETFTFDHPKVNSEVEDREFDDDRIKQIPATQEATSWTRRLKWSFLQLFTQDTYKTMKGDSQNDLDNPEIIQTMSTLSARVECVSEPKASVYMGLGELMCWSCIIVLVLAMGIVGMLLLTTNFMSLESSTNNVISTNTTNSSAPGASREETLRDILGSLSGHQLLEDPLTPQYQAFEWILYEDSPFTPPESYKYEMVTERYIAALLFFFTKGNQWTQPINFLSSKSICEWNSVVTVRPNGQKMVEGIQCNENGRVMRIVLPRNNLTGSLPWELASLEYLQALRAPRNRLLGSIPSQLGLLSDLRVLDLINNSIEGSMPTEFGWLKQIRFIRLKMNKIEGNIPTTVGRMTNLKHVDVSNNQMTGNLPSELGNLDDLQFLDVSQNQFQGTVPSVLGGDDRRYDLLNLSYNNFVGSLDIDFCAEKNFGLDSSFVIFADCGGLNAEVECSCCTCCDRNTSCDN